MTGMVHFLHYLEDSYLKLFTYSSKSQGEIKISFTDDGFSLHTKRLLLIPFTQVDREQLIKSCMQLYSSSDNVQLFGDGHCWSIEEVTTFVDKEIKHWQSGGGFGVFAIYEAGSNRFMGNLYVEFIPDDFAAIGVGHSNVAELAYILDKQFWGKGYGTEIAVAGKKYVKYLHSQRVDAGQPIDFNEVVATVDPSNIGSRRILEKTLKRTEPNIFTKYDHPRILFFKSLSLPAQPSLANNNQVSI